MQPGAVGADTCGGPLNTDFVASASTTQAAQTTPNEVKTEENGKKSRKSWGNCTETRLLRLAYRREGDGKLAEFSVKPDSESWAVLGLCLVFHRPLERLQHPVPTG